MYDLPQAPTAESRLEDEGMKRDIYVCRGFLIFLYKPRQNGEEGEKRIRFIF